MRRNASIAARTSRPVRKTRTRPPKRSPPPANSSIRKPAATTSSRRKKLLPRSNAALKIELPTSKPGPSGRAWHFCRRLFVEHRDRRQGGCGVFFDAVSHAKDIRGNDRDLASRLYHACAADQALAGRG